MFNVLCSLYQRSCEVLLCNISTCRCLLYKFSSSAIQLHCQFKLNLAGKVIGCTSLNTPPIKKEEYPIKIVPDYPKPPYKDELKMKL